MSNKVQIFQAGYPASQGQHDGPSWYYCGYGDTPEEARKDLQRQLALDFADADTAPGLPDQLDRMRYVEQSFWRNADE
ncbi:MAG: hypothetical protein E6R04_07265 [Spirochaetes bacterium]|nr:MAG: hypothetical protein E6R04_07265 [Spirochaetota bacterium]